MSEQSDKLGELTEWLRGNAPDCGDNSCLFGGRGKGGMRTNGGCRCFKDVRPDMKRIFIERMWAAICAPSSTGATPLCAGHADTWFTGRNHLPGDHSCVVCAFAPSPQL